MFGRSTLTVDLSVRIVRRDVNACPVESVVVRSYRGRFCDMVNYNIDIVCPAGQP